jgi:hypothetical protein
MFITTFFASKILAQVIPIIITDSHIVEFDKDSAVDILATQNLKALPSNQVKVVDIKKENYKVTVEVRSQIKGEVLNIRLKPRFSSNIIHALPSGSLLMLNLTYKELVERYERFDKNLGIWREIPIDYGFKKLQGYFFDTWKNLISIDPSSGGVALELKNKSRDNIVKFFTEIPIELN